jgi:hypothetical protein
MTLDQTKQVEEHLDGIQPPQQQEENGSPDVVVQVAATAATDDKSSEPYVEEASQGDDMD